MCYIIITGGNLVWFILSIATAMLIASAIVTPKWLIGPSPDRTFLSPTMSDTTIKTLSPPINVQVRYPSVGIYTRCKVMMGQGFHCGPFDLDGFATDNHVYPPEWKATMFFISLGFVLFSLTVLLTLVTCCRQSAFNKSIHNMTGCAQVISGIFVLLAIFLHLFGWGAKRVQLLCGADAEPFYPADCSIGISFYCAVIGAFLCFICAMISLIAESSNNRSRVKQRIEGGERLVCIP